MTTLRRIAFTWDRQRHLLWACVSTTTGQEFRIGFPLAHVEVLFSEELQKEGIEASPRVGGYPDTTEFCGWVDGLGRHYDGEAVGAAHPPVLGDADLVTYDEDEIEEPVVSGLFKKMRRRIKRAFKKTVKRVGRRAKGFLRRAGRLGSKALRSKALGWAVRGAAVAFPAVGGPALAAYTAARTAANTVRQAKRLARGGRRALRAASRGRIGAAIAKATRVQAQARQLASRNTHQARLLQSALRSTRI
jgi:hypothetical protein